MLAGLLNGFKSLFPGGGGSPSDNGFRERRKLIRMRCSYEVKGLLGDKKFKATVVDIGVQGLKIRTGQQLKVGDRLRLAPPEDGIGRGANPVDGKVVWVKTTDKSYARHVGLVFTTKKEEMGQSWVKMLLKELGFKPKAIFTNRRFIRADCFLDAKFQSRQVGREVSGRVYNIGVGGMLLETHYDLPMNEGTEMEFVAIDGLPVLRLLAYPVQVKKDGTVRLIGLEFRDLSARQLDVLSQYLKKLLKANFNQDKA